MSLRTRYWTDIVQAARASDLDPVLVEAIVLKESSGNTDAFRFEPVFWNRYLKPKPEWAGKNPRRVSSSYGLMQIMYTVALECGLDPRLPPEVLFVPEIGLKWGTIQLKRLIDWAHKGWPTVESDTRLRAAIASYNGGRGGNKPTERPLRNESYAKAVIANYIALQKEHNTIKT